MGRHTAGRAGRVWWVGKKFARAGHRRRVVVVRRILSAPRAPFCFRAPLILAYEIAQLDFSLRQERAGSVRIPYGV